MIDDQKRIDVARQWMIAGRGTSEQLLDALDAVDPLRQVPGDFDEAPDILLDVWFEHPSWRKWRVQHKPTIDLMSRALTAALAVLNRSESGEVSNKTEQKMMKLIDERDAAEEALSQAYYLVTGKSPDWSSGFGRNEALGDIEDACALLREVAKSADRDNEVKRLLAERDAAIANAARKLGEIGRLSAWLTNIGAVHRVRSAMSETTKGLADILADKAQRALSGEPLSFSDLEPTHEEHVPTPSPPDPLTAQAGDVDLMAEADTELDAIYGRQAALEERRAEKDALLRYLGNVMDADLTARGRGIDAHHIEQRVNAAFPPEPAPPPFPEGCESRGAKCLGRCLGSDKCPHARRRVG